MVNSYLIDSYCIYIYINTCTWNRRRIEIELLYVLYFDLDCLHELRNILKQASVDEPSSFHCLTFIPNVLKLRLGDLLLNKIWLYSAYS